MLDHLEAFLVLQEPFQGLLALLGVLILLEAFQVLLEAFLVLLVACRAFLNQCLAFQDHRETLVSVSLPEHLVDLTLQAFVSVGWEYQAVLEALEVQEVALAGVFLHLVAFLHTVDLHLTYHN